MSSIYLPHHVSAPASAAHVSTPSPAAAVRSKRAITIDPPADTSSQSTLPSGVATSGDADRQLQNLLATWALRQVSDSLVQIPPNSTIYPGFSALRSAFNSAQIRDWAMSKGLALDTLVVTADSITGLVMEGRRATRKTFTLSDTSGWWQVSARLRAAAGALDTAGKGVAYIPPESQAFSRNAVLHWYGVTPPTQPGELNQVRDALLASDWSALSTEAINRLQSRYVSASKAIGRMDERVHLVSCLSDLVRNRPDDEEVALTTLRTPVSATSGLSVDGSGRAAASDVLLACGLTIPKTIGEVRNTIRWLNAVIAPAPVLGNYAQLLGREWAPGRLSDTDKRSVAKFNDEDVYSSASGATVLRGLDFRGVLDDNTPQVLRDQADHFIDQILSHRVALLWGESVARTLSFQGASGAYELSALEAKQWTLAAFLLQIDPDFPGRPGTLVGYDIYQAGNNGRTIASVRADVEAHLSKNPLLDAQTTPLAAHLFLASSAPEFLVKGIPPTLRMGSAQWTDFRLGVAFAERQGGPGSSRAMSYDEIMALSKLEPMTDDQTAVLTNHGIDALLDWAVMQGVFAKPTDGVYTPQHYQQASKAFQAQNEQLVQALQVFNVPLPTRRDLAISQLRKVFPEHSVEQLKALTVYIADPAERRNQKPSEPVTRSLVETYMTGELVKDRWMLLAPGEQPPQLPKANSPFDIHRRLQPADQAAVDQNVRDLNARIADLPDVQAQLPDKVDAYLAALKQGLSTTTRKMIAELPLADRQALEYGEVELFALREQTDAVLTLEQTSAQVEERRGRQGTLIRCVHNGAVSYFEVFAAKMLIVKREDLPAQLTLGGTLENHQKTYGRWAPTDVQTQNGAPEPFDFAAYTSDAGPRAGMTSPGIIIDKLGDTLPALDSRHADSPVPNSFASARSQAIVERIMQGNFIHHRDTVLKIAQDELPIEQAREVSQRNKALFLSMIPFVGAIIDLVNGNIVEGSRGLIIDMFAALLGGAGTTVRSLAKATKAVAPFGAKAFSVLEKGVLVVSAFLNPLDGTADLIRWGSKGLLTLPQTVAKAPKLSAVTKMVAVEEKLRTFFGVKSALGEAAILQEGVGQRSTHNGHNHSVPVQALQANGHWYAVNPQTGLPISTPLDGFTPLSST